MCYFSFAFAFFSFLLGSFTLFSFLPPACLLGPKTHPPMQACLGLSLWLRTSLKNSRFKYSFPEGESLCEPTMNWTCFSRVPGNAAFLFSGSWGINNQYPHSRSWAVQPNQVQQPREAQRGQLRGCSTPRYWEQLYVAEIFFLAARVWELADICHTVLRFQASYTLSCWKQ